MLSFHDAKELAEQYIATLETELGKSLMLIDDATLERDFGWVFFYNSRSYIETGNFSDCLVGNAPLIVARSDGSVHVTGTAYPTEHYIEEFSRRRTT